MNYWNKQITTMKERKAVRIPKLIVGIFVIVVSILGIISHNSVFSNLSSWGLTILFIIWGIEELIYEKQKMFGYIFIIAALFFLALNLRIF